MRRTLVCIIILTLIATCAGLVGAAAHAAPAPRPAAAPDVSVRIDGLPLAFSVPLQRETDRVLVPFRAISEAIGVTVDWLAAERGIVATRPASAAGPAVEVRLWIDRSMASVNGQEQALDVPPRLVDSTTFIPARFFATAFGCGVDWDEATDRVLITTPAQEMVVHAFYALGNSWADLFALPYPAADLPVAHQRLLSAVGYGWYTVGADGRLRDDDAVSGWRKPSDWQSVPAMADAAGLTDEMVINAVDAAGTLSNVLLNPQAATALQAAIVTEAARFEGVNLDWENLAFGRTAEEAANIRSQYAQFVEGLAGALHAAGKRLTVTVQPGNGAFAAGYDYARLGAAADRIILMAYDYYSREQPSAPAPLALVEGAVKALVSVVPAEKVLLGVAPGGVEWRIQPTASRANPLTLADVVSLSQRATLTWDDATGASWFRYQDGAGATYEVWLEDGRSVAGKIALAKRYRLGGLSFWRLGAIPAEVWTALEAATLPERGEQP